MKKKNETTLLKVKRLIIKCIENTLLRVCYYIKVNYVYNFIREFDTI